MIILSIFGTSPAAIKMAPITKGLAKHPENEPISKQTLPAPRASRQANRRNRPEKP